MIWHGHNYRYFPLSPNQNHLVFIDPTITNYQNLVAGVQGASVIFLDANRDGVEQISEAIEQYTDIASVHIISHGSSGNVNLGNTQLGTHNLDIYAGELQSWADALLPDADILFYGCNVGAGITGDAFVHQVSQLTDADVAASDDFTGYGGDWDLEVTVGSVEAGIVIDASSQATYQGTLVTFNGHVYVLTSSATTWEEGPDGNLYHVDLDDGFVGRWRFV